MFLGVGVIEMVLVKIFLDKGRKLEGFRGFVFLVFVYVLRFFLEILVENVGLVVLEVMVEMYGVY